MFNTDLNDPFAIAYQAAMKSGSGEGKGETRISSGRPGLAMISTEPGRTSHSSMRSSKGQSNLEGAVELGRRSRIRSDPMTGLDPDGPDAYVEAVTPVL